MSSRGWDLTPNKNLIRIEIFKLFLPPTVETVGYEKCCKNWDEGLKRCAGLRV
jgi:hypothetical protein